MWRPPQVYFCCMARPARGCVDVKPMSGIVKGAVSHRPEGVGIGAAEQAGGEGRIGHAQRVREEAVHVLDDLRHGDILVAEFCMPIPKLSRDMI
jgi:hypothetical protein